jgi:hypothetical protein
MPLRQHVIHLTTDLQDEILAEIALCETQPPTPDVWARVKALEWVLERAGVPRR